MALCKILFVFADYSFYYCFLSAIRQKVRQNYNARFKIESIKIYL